MQITGRRGVVWRPPQISADGLKLLAGVILLLQTIGATVIEKGLIHLDQYTQKELSEMMATDSDFMVLSGIGSVLQIVAGLAVPLFAFFLVEGFRKTSSYKNYLIGIVIFALVSEIPYDLAYSQRIWDWSSQNAMVGLAISLLMLYFIRMLEEKMGAACRMGKLVIVLCAVVWVTVLRAQYGLCLVLLVAILYLFRDRGGFRTFLGIIVSLLYITGPLGFYFIWLYSGERKDRWPKYAYYLFYPAHLLILGVLTAVL